MVTNRQDDPENDGVEEEALEVCTVCRRAIPVRQIITLMTRPVCLNCAAAFYEDEDE